MVFLINALYVYIGCRNKKNATQAHIKPLIATNLYCELSSFGILQKCKCVWDYGVYFLLSGMDRH